MKYTTFTLLAILFCSNAFSKILDEAIIIIGNDVITRAEFEKKLKFTINQFKINSNSIPENDEIFHEKLLDHMVNVRLQINYAKTRGMNIQESMVDQAMENIANKQNLTLTKFREKIIDQGLDYNIYRSSLKEELITREIQKRVVSDRSQISSKEIDDFVKHQSHIFTEDNQYKISIILVSHDRDATIDSQKKAKEKIKMIQEKFLNGENFSNLAKNYSDSENASLGGDLGWKKMHEIPKIFLKDLEITKKGNLSNIIETENGYYIFYLENLKEMINNEIEERKVRHILIKTNAIVTDEIAKNKLSLLKKRIENGETFSSIAKGHSEDATSAVSNGEISWSSKGSFVAEFEDNINKLPLNKISEPFSTQFGWHILEVLEKRIQKNTEEIKKNLAKEFIMKSRSNEIINNWLIELKQQNFIKYFFKDKNNISERNLEIQKVWDPFY